MIWAQFLGILVPVFHFQNRQKYDSILDLCLFLGDLFVVKLYNRLIIFLMFLNYLRTSLDFWKYAIVHQIVYANHFKLFVCLFVWFLPGVHSVNQLLYLVWLVILITWCFYFLTDSSVFKEARKNIYWYLHGYGKNSPGSHWSNPFTGWKRSCTSCG